jgi:hypothetical protein
MSTVTASRNASENGSTPVKHLDLDVDLSPLGGEAADSVQRHEFECLKEECSTQSHELVQSLAELKKQAEENVRRCQEKISRRLQDLDAAFRAEIEYREEAQQQLAGLLNEEAQARKADAAKASEEVQTGTQFLMELGGRMDSRNKELKETVRERLGILETRLKTMEDRLQAEPAKACQMSEAVSEYGASSQIASEVSTAVDALSPRPHDLDQMPEEFIDRIDKTHLADTASVTCANHCEVALDCEKRLVDVTANAEAGLAAIAAKLDNVHAQMEERLGDARQHFETLVEKESQERSASLREALKKLNDANLSFELKFGEATSRTDAAIRHFAAQLIGVEACLQEKSKSSSSAMAPQSHVDDSLAAAEKGSEERLEAACTEAVARLSEATASCEQKLVDASTRGETCLTELVAKLVIDVEAHIQEKLEAGSASVVGVTEKLLELSNRREWCGVETASVPVREVSEGQVCSHDNLTQREAVRSCHGCPTLNGTSTSSEQRVGERNVELRFAEAFATFLETEAQLSRGQRCGWRTPDVAFVEASARYCASQQLEQRLNMLEKRVENRSGVVHRRFVPEPCPELPVPRDQSAPEYNSLQSL